ncbi:helix-turn-helix domain-containing protein [Ideonella sp. DXS29W]|uniref:Helix-turn-helix domain-containing protein n=1 Tax=Ideonella lacteola TaxID=2984193 RepID=A0ABU9BU68_9BURK
MRLNDGRSIVEERLAVLDDFDIRRGGAGMGRTWIDCAPMPSPGLSAAPTRLWLPPLALAGCVRGVMLRDTTSAALPPERRFNHYPASPLCTMSWWFAGTGEWLAPGAVPSLDSPRTTSEARITFAGPHTHPTISWNPGPARGMMLLLMPDAVQRLAGVDPRQWVNRVVPAEDALPADWMTLGHAVLQAADDDRRIALIETFFAERWSTVREQATSHRYRDWAEALALRAATTRTGRSLRQIERRVRDWAGLPLRELRGFGRAERAFFEVIAASETGDLSWSALAVDTGYFDQSHLSRISRRITGFPPEELRRRIAEDEGFWAYRVWQ